MWPFTPNKQQVYEQYAQAYEQGNYNNIDQDQVRGDLLQFVQNAPPETQHHIFRQHFAHLSPDQRAMLAQQFPPEYGVDPNDSDSMAHGMVRLKRERPDLLERMLDHPVLLATSVGLAGLVAKHMLEKRER